MTSTRYKKQSSFHSPVSITNWTQTVQWVWFFCGQPWLQNSKSSWYWWYYTIVLHLLRVQFAVVGRFGEQSWWGAWWCRCPIHAPPWTTKNIHLTTRWWELLSPYKKHCAIQAPTATTGRTYRICDEDYDRTVATFASLHSWIAVDLMLWKHAMMYLANNF